MPARSRKLLAIVAALLALSMAGMTACGEDEERTSGEEGEFIKAGEATYQVQLTRLLNPRIRPDDSYLRGQPPLGEDELFIGVFITIENDGDQPYSPPRDMKLVDTIGNEYLPLDATQGGFGLDFGEPIPPGDIAPPPNSPAAEGPSAGSLVVFRVRQESATENLPLEFEIPTGSESSSRIELDI